MCVVGCQNALGNPPFPPPWGVTDKCIMLVLQSVYVRNWTCILKLLPRFSRYLDYTNCEYFKNSNICQGPIKVSFEAVAREKSVCCNSAHVCLHWTKFGQYILRASMVQFMTSSDHAQCHVTGNRKMHFN